MILNYYSLYTQILLTLIIYIYKSQYKIYFFPDDNNLKNFCLIIISTKDIEEIKIVDQTMRHSSSTVFKLNPEYKIVFLYSV